MELEQQFKIIIYVLFSLKQKMIKVYTKNKFILETKTTQTPFFVFLMLVHQIKT